MQPPSIFDPVEIRAMSDYELGVLLNGIDTHTAQFTRIANELDKALGKAEQDLENTPGDTTLSGFIKRQRHELKAAERTLSFLKGRRSSVQSIMKAMGPRPQ